MIVDAALISASLLVNCGKASKALIPKKLKSSEITANIFSTDKTIVLTNYV